MKFYCLHEGFYEGVQLRLDQLEAACQSRGVEFVPLDSLTVDYTRLPRLGKGDMLYNASRGSETLETLLLNEYVTTFYIKNPSIVTFNPDTTKYSILHEKAGLPAPKTIFQMTNDRDLLARYADYLGGFPIVLKSRGGTRGIGTVRIDSWQGLISMADYLVTTPDAFVLRQFIRTKRGYRLIVLGEEVIAAADFAMNEGDFRNAAVAEEVAYSVGEYSESARQLAVQATAIAGVKFSGVDLLEDENGNLFLLEINFPAGFSGLIDVCGVDIPGKMLEYLAGKAG